MGVTWTSGSLASRNTSLFLAHPRLIRPASCEDGHRQRPFLQASPSSLRLERGSFVVNLDLERSIAPAVDRFLPGAAFTFDTRSILIPRDSLNEIKIAGPEGSSDRRNGAVSEALK